MNALMNAGCEGALVVTQFYYSQTFPYLMMKHQAEIRWRMVEVPLDLQHRELVPQLSSLGESTGDPASLAYVVSDLRLKHGRKHQFHQNHRDC